MRSTKALSFLMLAAIVAVVLVGPSIAHALPTNALELKPVQNLFKFVVNPLVRLLFAAAAFYFIYGVWSYIRKADDPGERAQGGNHILYSTIGLFIMISVWGIIAVIEKTVN